ncbi:hypothetical protein PIIN_10900 [Serendipita indica DSM 11827]|uniref:Uncharacterized protein n=1 Tax=Serendipita indica (strain DSM 11827) TaxID=1109443 RepID=G4U024_SERID|nr:hypothetical protein PIIN_10900 [Serendipita indica DSM 11827]
MKFEEEAGRHQTFDFDESDSGGDFPKRLF